MEPSHMSASGVNKVVLAYSGGLDTSIILKWLEDEYQCEVVTFTADLGQGGEVEPARAKAKAAGVKEIYVEDLREEFVREYVFPMFRANAIYEGEYLLGTSIARPLIAKRLVEIARETGADAISHGATGKGNDQVRFELGAYALMPDVKIIAPWREWDLLSREKLMDYAQRHGIPVELKREGKKSPYSMDANLLHISPPETLAALCEGAAHCMPPGGVLHIYGPFKRSGAHTSPGNTAFDESLRARNPAWGIRDLESVVSVAAGCGFRNQAIVNMPANNFSLVFVLDEPA